MHGIDDDTEALLKKRVYDMAGSVKSIKVYLNDERIPIRNFRQYIDLYVKATSQPGSVFGVATEKKMIHQVINDRWEVAFTLSEGQFQQVHTFLCVVTLFCFDTELAVTLSEGQ
jgi:DNA topoisomerase-2